MVDIVRVRAPNITCSDAIRRLVINAYTVNYCSTAQIATTFLISQRTVQRIIERFYEDNETDKKKQGGYKPRK